MKNKSKSTKNINPNRKFETGKELINKLDKLYQSSLINQKNSSVKTLFFSGFRQRNPPFKLSKEITIEKKQETLDKRSSNKS